MTFEETLDQLDRALATTGRIVAGVAGDQWGDPTPCAEWDVRQVANHLVGGLSIFALQLDGQDYAVDHDGHDWLGADPSASYAAAAGADRAAWRRPGADATVFDLAFGNVPAPMAVVVHLTEVVVHGLDIAVATGQEDLADEPAAAGLLATMHAMGTEVFRVPGIFGPEVAAAEGDPAHRRLLAYLGRRVTVG